MVKNNTSFLKRFPYLQGRTGRLILFNIGLIAWYFFIFGKLHVPINHEVMFASDDAQSYYSVSEWMISGKQTEFLEHRPILLPLILLVLNKIGGAFLIWFFQFILWMLSANLIVASVRKLTTNGYLSIIAGIVFIGNLSLIALTLHALTEVLNVFLLDVLMWYFIRHFENRRSVKFILNILFLFTLLVLCKPVYSIPFWIILMGIVPLFYFKLFVQKPLNFAWLIVVLSPLLIQVSIMKVNYDTFSVSNISDRTFERYLFAQGLGEVKQIDRAEALELAANMSSEERSDYFKEHLSVFTNLFFQNIEINIKEKATFLQFPVGYGNKFLAEKMKTTNGIYWFLHLIFVPLALLVFLLSLFKKRWDVAILITAILGLAFYYVFVTGISFYQGDRLVIGAFPLWLVAYFFVGFQVYLISTKRFEKKADSSN